MLENCLINMYNIQRIKNTFIMEELNMLCPAIKKLAGGESIISLKIFYDIVTEDSDLSYLEKQAIFLLLMPIINDVYAEDIFNTDDYEKLKNLYVYDVLRNFKKELPYRYKFIYGMRKLCPWMNWGNMCDIKVHDTVFEACMKIAESSTPGELFIHGFSWFSFKRELLDAIYSYISVKRFLD